MIIREEPGTTCPSIAAAICGNEMPTGLVIFLAGGHKIDTERAVMA
jgi:hypothetical protein